MRWLKKERWEAGIAVAGMLLLLVLMIWVPVSAAGADAGASGLATPVTGTVQVTPTEDATVTALNKEKLAQEVQQLKNQNDHSTAAWFWNSGGLFGTVIAALLAVVGVLATVVVNFQQWKESQIDAQDKDRIARQDAQDKDLKDKAEERFKTAVAALGDEKEGTQVGGAILLRSFLHEEDKKIYERYYPQIFDLAVAYLRLPRTPNPSEDPDGLSQSPVDPNIPLPLTTLSRALSVVFKEAFPLARSQNKGDPQSLDASYIQLDNAYLVGADLEQVWMPHASLRKADLRKANLIGARLSDTDLREVYLSEAKLGKAYLVQADLGGAKLGLANLAEARLSRAKLGGAGLSGANLKDAILYGVEGLTKEQLEDCKEGGALIDEGTMARLSQATVSPPSLSQSNDAQAPSAPPPQVNTPPPGTDESTAPSSKPSNGTQAQAAPPVQQSMPTSETDGSSAASSKPDPGA